MQPLTRNHLTWYQQQFLPAWGQGLQVASQVSIDKLVNTNGRCPVQLRNDRSVYAKKGMNCSNGIALLKMVRRNMETGAIPNRVYYDGDDIGPETLLRYMAGYTQQDGRLNEYRRWARRLQLRNAGFRSTKAWVKYVWKCTYMPTMPTPRKRG
jgi:hypothetical protein